MITSLHANNSSLELVSVCVLVVGGIRGVGVFKLGDMIQRTAKTKRNKKINNHRQPHVHAQ